MSRFYKGARPDGWDFYTGRTINYREAIGKIVHVPSKDMGAELCSATVLHASRNPNDVFVGSKIPLSLFIVEGTPAVEDSVKSGFKEFKVIEEIPEENFNSLFEFDYKEFLHPLDPMAIKFKGEITIEEKESINERTQFLKPDGTPNGDSPNFLSTLAILA